MRWKRPVVVLLELAVLLGGAALLFHSWRNRPAPPTVATGDNDEDDVKYNPRVPVHVVAARRVALRAYVVATGTVEPTPARGGGQAAVASVTAPVASLVSSVAAVEGHGVKQGDVLFTLDPRGADVAVARATRNVESTRESVLQYQKGATDGKVAEQYLLRARHELELARSELDAASAQRKLLDVTSPLAGTVVQVMIHPGEVASPAAVAVQVVDLDRLTVAASVPASDLRAIRVGQKAELLPRAAASIVGGGSTTQPATQPAPVPGVVTFVDTQVDPRTGLASVDVSMPAGAGLRVGEHVSLRVVTEEKPGCLAVPAECVVRDADGTPGISVLIRDDQWAVRRPVELGLRDSGLVEVRADDVTDGTLVVTTGAYALPDRSRIEIAK